MFNCVCACVCSVVWEGVLSSFFRRGGCLVLGVNKQRELVAPGNRRHTYHEENGSRNMNRLR